jgi:predicted nucleic acid-binding protein
MIFLDASFLVAYYAENDDHHDKAVRIMKDIKNKEKIIS